MAAVPSALAPYVTSLVAYDVDMGAPGVHRGLPTTSLTFVLPMGEPLDVGWADGRGRGKRWSTVSGLHAGPAAIHHDGRQRGIQLGLTTAGARALLGVPAAELAGELVELGDLAPDLADLPERLDGLTLAARAGGGDRGADPGPGAARRGRTAGRGGPGARRADPRRTGGRRWPRRSARRRRLTTLVRRECGLAPKEYQRVARFEASRAVLGGAQGRALAAVAAECGYADQGHLARDWSRLAGCPPSTWLREEFPFLQDPGGLLGAE